MNRTLANKREQSATEERRLGGNKFLVAPGVWRLKDIFVNVFIIQNREGTDWVLVDAGLKTSAPKIKALAKEVFGSAGSRPKAILMTHGHFDHRGSLLQLAEEWGVPVYCHHQERPYLTGQASYPPPDPSVGGGMMATLSFLFPRDPINVEDHLQELPADGMIPELEDWRWIHTPGHTPGHISLFREKDGVLVAGDAFVTTVQESLVSVITQAKIIWGPPKYFTPDWGAAARSVRALADLEPNVIVTGHGQAMYGDEARKALNKLAREFWQRGIPAQGRYVKEPARFDENGVPTHIPKHRGTMAIRLLSAAALLTLGYLIYRHRKQSVGWEKKISESLGKKLMTGSLGVLGASAPATSAAPALPLIPAV
ncbi:MAG: MBL fold metallo-hydrolase [Flavisolibacter sp.]|nr:MBL fold metallo-hydrolase [Flavisolibacter sp.]